MGAGCTHATAALGCVARAGGVRARGESCPQTAPPQAAATRAAAVARMLRILICFQPLPSLDCTYVAALSPQCRNSFSISILEETFSSTGDAVDDPSDNGCLDGVNR